MIAVNGNTAAPMQATPEAFRARGFADVPEAGILAAGVPAAFSALLTALRRWGTMSLLEVIAPALDLARNGFPVSEGLRGQHKYGLVAMHEKFLHDWPASARLYLPGGRVPEVGQLLKNESLARTYDYLANAKDPHAAFYKGAVAAEIAKFSQERDGFLARGDLERFETRIEEPARLRFGYTELFKCGFWTQGPAELQTIALMSRFDLGAMEPGGADYCHLLIEATKLAFADREQYYGDPAQALVPAEVLLSADYTAQRAALIDVRRASLLLRPGDPQADRVRVAAYEGGG